ncbi:MAG: hypothetical protein ACSLFP_08770 [Acidimicrobiales bacterium]
MRLATTLKVDDHELDENEAKHECIQGHLDGWLDWPASRAHDQEPHARANGGNHR